MSEATGDGDSRGTHERRVVEALLRAPTDEVAQPELIRKTGLARGTVVSIIQKLKERDLLETGVGQKPGPEGGRPAKVVSIRSDAGYALGVQFGHHHVRVAAGSLRGYQVFFEEEPVGSAAEAAIDVGANAQASLDLAVQLVKAAIAQNEEEGRGPEKLLAVTVGWPAPVQNWETGDVVIDESMRPWLGIRRPADKLKKLLDLGASFWTENDANLAAIMELEHGAGQHHKDFVYVHWSSGIGGGLVSGGQLRPGGSRISGELGHVPLPGVEAAPIPCRRCGSDHCLEALAGGAAISRNVTGKSDTSLREIITLAEASGPGGEKARKELERAAWLMGRALGPIVTFNNPTAIVIGGHFGRHPDEETATSGRDPYDLIEASLRASLQEHSSPLALDAIVEMYSSPWRYGTVQGAVAFATRKALDKFLDERTGAKDAARHGGGRPRGTLAAPAANARSRR